MKTVFLQTGIVLIGLMALAVLVWFPMMEGRAEGLDLFSIYLDPFILYGYAVSIAFFVALYKGFKLLGHMGRNKLFTSPALGAIKSIKRCAILLGVSTVAAGLYIRMFHAQGDDPVGFLSLSIVLGLCSFLVAMAAAQFEKKVRNGINMNSK